MLMTCRVGDVGEGYCTDNDHNDNITATVVGPGCGAVLAEGMTLALMGDLVIGDDNHAIVAVILTGSGSVTADGVSVARIGDYFEEDASPPKLTGTLITGAASVFAE